MKIDLFQSCGHAEFSKFAGILIAALSTTSSVRICNSSAGIPSPPLALFVVMLPKTHLTSHSRMSGSRWMITPSWSSGSWRSFLYSSSVYSCHLFLIPSASVRSVPFPSFIVSIFAWNVPLMSLIFLKRSLVFPILLFSCFLALIAEEGFIFSPCYSLELCIQMGISFLFYFTFSFSSFPYLAGCKASSDSHFACLHSFFLGMVWITASCIVSRNSVYSSSGSLSDLIPWICLSLPIYNHKGFDLGHPWMV